jgi:hypothetical protein
MSEQTALTTYDEQFAAMAAQYAGAERATGTFLSTKGGILTFQNDPLPGNQMAVVILEVVRERTFYNQKYDGTSEHNNPPVCYAFSRMDESEDEMGPHPTMQADLSYFQPQNDICQTCPNNAWGSADTGRGKACGERRRVAVLPAGMYSQKRGSRDFELEIITDPDHYRTADIAYLKLPVMSVKNWARYVTTIATANRRPPQGVITRVYLEPDPKSQFQAKFELLEMLPPELYPVIMARAEEAAGNIIFGYQPPSAEAEEAPARTRGVRR